MSRQYIPIEIIAAFGTNGKPMPSKLKVCTGDDVWVIKRIK